MAAHVYDRSGFAKALGFLFLSLIFFDLMSVQVRVLVQTRPAVELSAYRNVFGIIPSLAVMVYRREVTLEKLWLDQWKLALFRGVLVAGAQLCLYTSLGFIELATVSALEQTNGLFIVLFSILILRERVGPWRWAALGMGMIGALMIVRPGSVEFQWASLLPVAAALGYSSSTVLVQLFDRRISTALIYVWGAVASAIASIALVLATGGFQPITSLNEGLMILTMSLSGGVAVLFLMLAYRNASPASIAPFGYFAILTAFVFGWVFFGEAPIDTLFPGVIFIVAGGAIVIWRQRQKSDD
jgi:drug/metabolite transporter (DMT)-like permease